MNFNNTRKNEDGLIDAKTIAIIIGVIGIVFTLAAIVISGGANLKVRPDSSTTRSLETVYTAEKAFYATHDEYVDGITLYSYSSSLKAQRSNRVYVLNSDSDEFCAIAFKAKVKSNRSNENVESLAFPEILKKRTVFSIDETGKIRGEDDKNACARGFKGNLSQVGYFDYAGYVIP